ncbi:MAG: hypothetical protein LBT59_16200 [Clostridiales bacterium]|jgi:hypothetical protein|nr:hypothetical protein [Clostridiales bacterium]
MAGKSVPNSPKAKKVSRTPQREPFQAKFAMCLKSAVCFSKALIMVLAVFTGILAVVTVIAEVASVRLIEDYAVGGILKVAIQVPRFLFFAVGVSMPRVFFNKFIDSGATRRQFAQGTLLSALMAALAFTLLRLAIDSIFQAIEPIAIAMYFLGSISAFIFGLLIAFPAIVRSWKGFAGYVSFLLFFQTFDIEMPPVTYILISLAFDLVGSIYFYIVIRHARVRV